MEEKMRVTIEMTIEEIKEYLSGFAGYKSQYNNKQVCISFYEGEWVNDCTPEEALEHRKNGRLPPSTYKMVDMPTEFKILSIEPFEPNP